MRFGLSILVCLFFAVPAFAQCDTGEAILKLGFAEDAKDSPRRRFAKAFSESASAALQGKACVLNVVSGSLYDDDKAVGAIQSGVIQLALPPFEKLTVIAPKLIVFSLPFAFRDSFALQRFVETPAYAGLLQPLSGAGLAPLGVLHGGFQQLAASKPVHGPEDVRGLRFRRTGAPDLASRPDLLGVIRKQNFPKPGRLVGLFTCEEGPSAFDVPAAAVWFQGTVPDGLKENGQ